MSTLSDEISYLRHCVRDLIALAALPAVWIGREPSDIAESLAEVLLSTLHLDLAYVHLTGSLEREPIEIIRTHPSGRVGQAQELGKAFASWLKRARSESSLSVPNPAGNGMIQVRIIPIGHGEDWGVIAAGSQKPGFPTELDRLLLGVSANQAAISLQGARLLAALREANRLKDNLLVSEQAARAEAQRAVHREQQYALQLRRLTEVSLMIHSAHSLDALLQCITEQARKLIGAHRGAMCVTLDQNQAQPISAVSLSEKYAAEREHHQKSGSSGIHPPVYLENHPVRMTQAELEAHPAWRELGKGSGEFTPPRGWLAAPLTGRDGHHLGLLQLSDKYQGEFTENDEAILLQLAQMASVAIENVQLLQEIQEANRRKDEFLAMLAHELRNPLAPILNALQVMHLRSADNPALRQSMAVVERQVRHMAQLLDDLLDVSRITRGKVQLRKEPLDLVATVTRAVETSRPLIETRKHELIISLPQEPIRLQADPIRLEQILVNLLNNAAKYTEPGGRIWLTCTQEGEEAVFRVRDTGIGIPPEMLSHIFDLFTQVDRSLDRSQGGLGIGLTLVRSLVEMHGGNVTVYSAGIDQGSEFIVRLPALAWECKNAEPREEKDRGAPVALRRRVLIVDDNVDAATTLGEVLELWGHEVRTVYDGPSAIEVASVYKPEIVLLDIGLPELDGYEVARMLRQQAGLSGAVLIALTGYGQEEDQRRGREAGFAYHFTKPVDLANLQGLLASDLAREGQSC